MGGRTKSLKIIRKGLAGVLIVTGGVLIWISADRFVARLFNDFQPYIEKALSKPLGHDLKVASFEGLRPWGIAIGETKIQKGLNDDSSAVFPSATIKIAPIASLLNLKPVIIFRPTGGSINLRPSIDGSYWVFGQRKGPAPKIGLRLHFDNQIKIAIVPQQIDLSAIGNIYLELNKKKINGFVYLKGSNKGTMFIKGRGFWNQLNLQARTRLQDFKIEPLQNLFPKKVISKATGNLNGDIQIKVNEKTFDCKGNLKISKFLIESSRLNAPLSSKVAFVGCKNSLLQFPQSEWKYGPWTALVKGTAPLEEKEKLILDISSNVWLNELTKSQLYLQGKLPLIFKKSGPTTGIINADIDLKPFPLSPLGSLFNISMAGKLSAKGSLYGPLNQLKTNLNLTLQNPQVNGVRLQEEWRGTFKSLPNGGGDIRIASYGAAVPGSIQTNLSKNWELQKFVMTRLGGQINVDNNSKQYKWEAKNFRLDRVEVAIPPERSFKRIFGQLSGSGVFNLEPFSVEGELTMRYPRLMGIRLKEVQLDGKYSENTFDIKGKLLPPQQGSIFLQAKGKVGGDLKSKAEAKNINARWLANTVEQLPKISLKTTSQTGSAKDLGKYVFRALGNSLDGRLNRLNQSHISIIKNKDENSKARFIEPNDFNGNIDGLVDIQGPNPNNLQLDLKVSGKLWPKGQKDKFDMNNEPIVVAIKGPLRGGMGEFSLLNIPFSLLSLISPIPNSLSGMFGVAGRYRFEDDSPEITAELILDKAKLAEQSLILDKGKFFLTKSFLTLDMILRGELAKESVKVAGQIPFKTSLPFDLRIESHGDGLRFLAGLTDNNVKWEEGSADLRFLIRGTLESPEANGFLVVKKAKFIVMEKEIDNLNSSMLFDFNRLEVQELTASIGESGTIKGNGSIAIFRSEESGELAIQMSKVPLKLPTADVQIASNLKVEGSLLSPVIGGDLNIKEGSISPKRKAGQKSSQDSLKENKSQTQKSKREVLPEQRWDMKKPLNLFVQDEEAPASKMLRGSIPSRFSAIGFKNLRLRLGPDLRITSLPVASFNTEGLLILNGKFNEDLSASGLLRLTNGRVNLFTTTFTLDRKEPNVAIFTPSMGLVPYIDVTMKSRVPDTVRDSSELTSNDFVTNGAGSFGIGGSRFVKVEVKAVGPADRISENFQLRSTPPMPQNQLLGLIGGNSLSRLVSGGEGEVLANVLNRSLISPFLGNVTGSFSERLEVSLYPAYINRPEVNEGSDSNNSTNPEESSGELSSQQAWVTEVGIDLTERFNFAVQATPNRTDIPPQGTLSFQVNSNLGVLSSLDKEGKWQSQVQLFFRF